MINKSKILWFTWKDLKHPAAGGAEIVNEQIAKRLAADGSEVIFIVGGFPNCESEEAIDGYKIIRLGNKWTIYLKAFLYYKKNLEGWADLVIDEMNTMPFFCKFYVKEKNILYVNQLCRQIWFYQLFFPASLIGYLLEPLYLFLLSGQKTIVISESTKKDLMRFGLKPENIFIISMGLTIKFISDLNLVKKFDQFTALSLGAIRPMKRTLDIIKAFEITKEQIQSLKLLIAGNAEGSYGKKVISYIQKSKHRDSIKYLGTVSKEEKISLMQRSHLILVTSVKEGWGLIVTEAGSQGTPALVYNVDGLRDSVRDNETGLVCKQNKPRDLARLTREIFENKEKYKRLQTRAWQWSQEINFNKCYSDFISIINKNL